MPSATRTVTINRPIDEVFAFFTTPFNDKKWRRHVKEIKAPGPLEVGTRIHQLVAGPRGRGIRAHIEVTRIDPPNAYDFRVVAGPIRPHGEFRLRPDGEGTEVTLTLSAAIGGLKGRLMERPVQKSMEIEVAGLETAKRVIESS